MIINTNNQSNINNSNSNNSNGSHGSDLCLKGAEEVADERMFAAEGQDLPLDEGALNVIVLQHLESEL
jgi:hypothetical protein